jgi:hypothetical protein
MTRPIVMMCMMLVPLLGHAAEEGPATLCAQARDDDTVRRYEPSLRAGLLRAYAHLFPQARMPPNEQEFQAGAHVRCMDGRLWACFTGANLPCEKMNTARDNKGAEAFCQTNPDAPVVPAFAAGHDTIYSYRCVAARAEITGSTFPLDARGFAATLWAPVD